MLDYRSVILVTISCSKLRMSQFGTTNLESLFTKPSVTPGTPGIHRAGPHLIPGNQGPQVSMMIRFDASEIRPQTTTWDFFKAL